jgi:hypothetical protein
MKSMKKMIYLEGMGGDLYNLNTCEIYYTFFKDSEEGKIKVEKCNILWGEPSCEGCPRDKILARLGLIVG